MSIFGKGVMAGGKRPIPINVSTNGSWSRDGGYSPVTVSVRASEVTSGTKDITANGRYDITEFKNVEVHVPASAVTSGNQVITANGDYDVTKFKNVKVIIAGATASTTPLAGVSYVDGLPSDWNIMKAVAKAISKASNYITANTTGAVYVNKGNTWAYKITPGNTINVNNQTYAVMGFNNFALTNQGNYGGTHSTAGLTFGAVNCVGRYQMNPDDSNKGGWGQCPMRTSTMPTLQQGMPNTLAQVKVQYVEDVHAKDVVYSDDYLFLPAEKEVFGTRT